VFLLIVPYALCTYLTEESEGFDSIDMSSKLLEENEKSMKDVKYLIDTINVSSDNPKQDEVNHEQLSNLYNDV
jgi:chromosome condensin MukBEF complex kleisin-like MukF subunit